MRNPGGWLCISDPQTGVTEADSFTCKHCGAVKFVKPKQRPEDIGGLCGVCAGLVCAGCVGKGCDPLEEKLRRMEASHEARRSYGMG